MIRIPAAAPRAVFTAVLAAVGAAALAQDGPARLSIAASEEYEQGYLATGDGRAVYMFTRDARGTGEAPPASRCHAECAEAWPPLLTDGAPEAGEGVDADLLGTIERDGGASQVTYAGWPLYRYFRDQGDDFRTHGQSLQTHGGVWHLLRPDGEINEDREF